jgi:RHS repeat-associated protein
MNGRPALRFGQSAASALQFSVLGSGGAVSTSNQLTVVVVGSRYSDAQTAHLWSNDHVGSGVSAALRLGDKAAGGAVLALQPDGTAAAVASTAGPIGDQVATIATLRLSTTGQLEVFRDGIAGGSAARTAGQTPLAGILGYYIDGEGTLPSSATNGLISEVLVYDRALDNTELAAVHAHLNDKYSIVPAVGATGLVQWLRADHCAGPYQCAAGACGVAAASCDNLAATGADALQPTKLNRPIAARDMLAGRHALRFDGTNDMMTLASAGAADSDYTVIAVTTPASPPEGATTWLRADRCAADGSRCPDLSGKGRDATPVDPNPTRRAQVVANRIGGQPALVFERTDAPIQWTDTNASLVGEYTASFVAERWPDTNHTLLFSRRYSRPDGTLPALEIYSTPAGVFASQFSNYSTSANAGNALWYSAQQAIPLVITVRAMAQRMELWVGGSLVASSAVASIIPMDMLGSTSSGALAEAVFYDRPLSDADLDRLHGYFQERYKLPMVRALPPVLSTASSWMRADACAQDGSRCTDLTGNGRDAVPGQPTNPACFGQRVENRIGGLPALVFDATDCRLVVSDATATLVNQYTASFVLERWEVPSPNPYTFFWINSYTRPDGSVPRVDAYTASQGIFFHMAENYNATPRGGGVTFWYSPQAVVPVFVTLRVLPDRMELWADGVLRVTTTVPSIPMTALGQVYGSALAEAVFFERGLSDPDLVELHTYLRRRYGLGTGALPPAPTFAPKAGELWSAPSAAGANVFLGNRLATDTLVLQHGLRPSAGAAPSWTLEPSTAPATWQPQILTVRASPTQHELFVDCQSAAAPTTNVAPAVLAGSLSSSVLPYQGSVAELLVFDHALSASELERVHSYLGRRYGLSAAQCAQVSCGDGVVSGSEVCDPGLDPGCRPDCTAPITNGATELSCRDGADNDADGLVDCADAIDCNVNAACRADEGQACVRDYDCESNLICSASSCRTVGCASGVRDPSETGRDCGGPCAACNGLQCESACRVGEQTAPPALDVLRFANGVFTRASSATFPGSNGELAVARPNELRWIDVGGARLALFEGASTNLLRWSESLDHAPEWMAPSSTPMAVVSNAGPAPDGPADAELLNSANGPSRSPTQAVQVPSGRSRLSIYLRSAQESLADGQLPVTRGVLATGDNVLLGTSEWLVGREWGRFDTPVSATTTSAASFGLSHVAGWPTNDAVALPAFAFFAWGAQLEAKPFATSYIPTTGSSSIRATDALTFQSIPPWITNGLWQVDILPLFGSDEMEPEWRYTVASFSSTQDIALVSSANGATAHLVVRFGGGSATSLELAWRRGALLTITLDIQGDRIIVGGADAGDGAFSVPNLAFSASAMRVGGVIDGQGEAFAAIGQPRLVNAVSVACAADAACSCGNGTIEPGEACDAAGNARCDELCRTIVEPQTAGSSADCPNGQVLAIDVGARFGLGPLDDVCWPAACLQQSPGLCGTTGSPCGECVCEPQCAGKQCGTDLSDGCGGLCAGACAPRQPGAQRDSDCTSGHVLGVGMGPRFGLPAGTNVCWPMVCADHDVRRIPCGTVASPCGICPPPVSTCGARVCGTVQGNSCGSCPANNYCTFAGECSPNPLSFDEQHPEAPPLPGDPGVDPVGTIPGSFAVTELGAASYSIPIEVPPGRAGMQPELALEYNSNSGDSYAGHGWSVRGLSAITLCNQTSAQNHEVQGVRLDGSDPFCLDGQQLFPMGESDVEFRTEFDSFRRILQIEDAWSGSFYRGPAGFIVFTKEGRVLVYGTSQTARGWARRPQGTTNVAWYLQAVGDTSGNTYSVEYENFPRAPIDATSSSPILEYSGEVRPKAILYGDNGSHKVEFKYEHDPAQLAWYPRGFMAGVGFHSSSVLSSIDTSVFDKLVRSYALRTVRAGSRRNLDQVTLRGANPDGTLTALPPTSFMYVPGLPDWTLLARTSDKTGQIVITYNRGGVGTKNVTRLSNLSLFPRTVLDYDGDGRQDLVHSGRIAMYPDEYLFQRAGTYNIYWFVLSQSKGEMDSQGHAFARSSFDLGTTCASVEVVKLDNLPGDNLLFGPCASGWTLLAYGKRIRLGAGEHMWAVDRDRDGAVDIVGCNDDDEWFYVNNADLRCDQTACTPVHVLMPVTRQCDGAVLDADHDGSKELLLFEGAHQTEGWILHGNDTRYWGPVPFGWDVKHKRLMDANGDGLTDVVVADEKKNELRLYLNTAVGFSAFSQFSGIPALFEYSFVIDQDGDGRSELMVPDQGTHRWRRHQPLAEGSGNTFWSVTDSTLPYRKVHKKVTKRRFQTETYDAWDWQMPTPMDWDGDGLQELVMRSGVDTDPVFEIWKGGTSKDGLLSVVSDGLGKVTTVSYGEKAGMPEYTAFAGACLEYQRCLPRAPRPLVIAHSVLGDAGPYRDPTSPGFGQIRKHFAYSYEDAREDTRGRGWLGFAKRTVHELVQTPGEFSRTTYEYNINDAETYSDLYRVYLGAGRPVRITTTVGAYEALGMGALVEHTVEVTNGLLRMQSAYDRPFIVVDRQDTRWIDNGNEVGSRADTFAHDEYGNQTVHSTLWSDGRQSETVTSYIRRGTPNWSAFEARGLIGLPDETTSVGVGDANAATPEVKVASTAFTHRDDGLVESMETSIFDETGARVPEQMVTFDYDSFGNQTSRAIQGRESVPQLYLTQFDGNGLYPTSVRNVVHQLRGLPPTTLAFDARTGQPSWIQQPDGSWQSFTHDALGRLHTVVDSTSLRTDVGYLRSAEGYMRVRVSGDKQPTAETDYNAFGLPFIDRTTAWSVGGASKTSVRETGYDVRGYRTTIGVPHFETMPAPGYHRTVLDTLGRITLEQHPRQTATGEFTLADTYHFWGSRPVPRTAADIPWSELQNAAWVHQVVDPANVWSESVTDLRGQIVGVRDPNDTLTRYAYGALDSLRSVSLLEQAVDYETDDFGRVIRAVDSNLGSFEYDYSGLGQVLRSRRNSRLSSYGYDSLGRMTSAVTPDGSYAWTFDGDASHPWQAGHLVSESLVSASLGNSSTVYDYQGAGAALSSITRNIGDEAFVTGLTYDQGRLDTINYPAMGGDSLGVSFTYNPYGQVESVVDSVSRAEFWRQEDVSPFGTSSMVRYGNGMRVTRQFEPATGRLANTKVTSLNGSVTHREESLTYDSRGLLATRTRPGTWLPTESFVHDALGRLREHHHGGELDIYGYDALGNLTLKPGIGELYYDGPMRTAVMHTDDGRQFGYDGEGNQTLRQGTGIPQGRQEIDYTEFGLPKLIRIGPDNDPDGTIRYGYDANGQRVMHEVLESAERTIYAGDLYRRISSPDGGTQYIARVPTPDGLLVELTGRGQGLEQSYMLTDHLRSVVGIEDSLENLTTREYEPFGATASGTMASRLGFTGHEAEESLGLINMKGRIYDPSIGRFLSPDPFVQAPFNSQSWNRYSYVFNSPMNFVDPSGFGCVSAFDPDGSLISTVCEPTHIGPSKTSSGTSAASSGTARHGSISATGRREQAAGGQTSSADPSAADELAPVLSTLSQQIAAQQAQIAALQTMQVNLTIMLAGGRPMGAPSATGAEKWAPSESATSTGFSPPPRDAETAAAFASGLDAFGDGVGWTMDMAGVDGSPGLPGMMLFVKGGQRLVATGISRTLNISGKQFGKKLAARARDLGLDPSSARVRYQLRNRIQRIFDNADEIRTGLFRGQGPGGSEGAVSFFRRGQDVVVTTPGGDFVTFLPGGASNARFLEGTVVP